MKLYTWKDIERHFCLTQEKWRNVINSVEVYPTDIILYIPENHQKDCSQTVQANPFRRERRDADPSGCAPEPHSRTCRRPR